MNIDVFKNQTIHGTIKPYVAFSLARAMSLKSDHHIRMGAVLAQGKEIVNVGRNYLIKTHPGSRSMNNRIHAEYDCLTGINRSRVENGTIFVYRHIRNTEDIALAKPCAACVAVLRQGGVRRAVFTDPTKLCGYSILSFSQSSSPGTR